MKRFIFILAFAIFAINSISQTVTTGAYVLESDNVALYGNVTHDANYLARFEYGTTTDCTDGTTISTHHTASGVVSHTIKKASLTIGVIYYYKLTVSTDYSNYPFQGLPVLSFTLPKEKPTTQASNISFGTISDNSIQVSFDRGNGDYMIIIAKQTNSINSTDSDLNGNEYTGANNNIGSAPEISTQTGEFVVYNGNTPTSGTVNIEGLESGTRYYFRAYEYNNSTTNTLYNSTTSATNPKSTTTTGPANWIGTTTNWNSGSNWSSSIVPSNNTDVAIPSGVANMPNISSSTFYCKDLTIKAGASLTITDGATLNATGNALLESPSNTGMPGTIHEYGTLNVTGTSTTQRYISDQTWHYFSSAVGGATVPDWESYYIAYFNEPTSAWVRIRNNTTEFNAGQGYELNRMNAPTLISLSGTFNKGEVIVSNLTNSGDQDSNQESDDGWNLVGNPYPSSIDMSSSGFDRTNIDASIYVLENGTTHTYVIGSGGDEEAKHIAPMQGFFVHAHSATGSVTFTDAMQTTNSVSYKSEQKTNNSKIISLVVASEKHSSKSYFAYVENATEKFDSEYDGYKLLGSNDSVPEVYSYLKDSTMISVNSYSLDTVNSITSKGFSYWLGVKKGISTQLTFSLSNLDKIPDNVDIFIYDRISKKETNLLYQDYSFTTSDNDDSTRFELIIFPKIIEMESISISTDLVNDSIEVNTTSQLSAQTEPTNASNKTVTWSVNNSSIASIDSNTGVLSAINDGIATIKATANDGSGVFGEISITVYNRTSIETTAAEKQIKFYPNPTNGIIKLESNSDNCKYTVYNSLGSIVKKGEFISSGILNLSDSENGVYYIEFIQNNTKQIELLIKEN